MPKKQSIILKDTTPLKRFHHIFSSQWKELLNQRKNVLKKSNPDAIHDLRIALRRFRVAVKLFEQFTASNAKKRLKKCLRNLTKQLGDLRNIDEAFLFFQPRIHFSDANKLYNKLTKMRTHELNRIKKSLDRFDHRFDKLIDEMKAQLKTTTFTDVNEDALLTYFSYLSQHFSKTIHDLLIISAVTKKSELRHALRIAIRKWRYHLEMISIILNRNYANLLKLLKKYQGVLGRINDVEAFYAMCGTMAVPAAENKLIQIHLSFEEKTLLEELAKLIRQKSLLKAMAIKFRK